jgi:hypothetical protein
MPERYRIGVALTSLVLALTLPAPGSTAGHPAPRSSAAPDDSLYSRRALRRARRILEFQLLELRKARLERVRQAILHHLPPDELPTNF